MNRRSQPQPAIRVVMMPQDTNPMGTIFGGIILSYIDQAGAVEAHRHSDQNLVTVAMHEVKFIAPVLVGDVVSFYAKVVKIGNTSITVRITVEAWRGHAPHKTVRVTQAEVVYVAVAAPGKPVPVRARPGGAPVGANRGPYCDSPSPVSVSAASRNARKIWRRGSARRRAESSWS